MDDATFEKALASFKANRTHGASELGRLALTIVADGAAEAAVDSITSLQLLLQGRVDQLILARPSMAPVINLLQMWQKYLYSDSMQGLSEMRGELVTRAEELVCSSEMAVSRVARNAADLIGAGRTVFTHSLSSTVKELFRVLQAKGVRAILTESRPLNEGYLLAEQLAEWSIPATLITESQIGLFMQQADVVVVGADSLLADGSLVNKAGSYLLALAASDYGIPFYVCCESFKRRTVEMEQSVLEEMDASELGAPRLEGVEIRNSYFDITPASMISGWIDEQSVHLANTHSP